MAPVKKSSVRDRESDLRKPAADDPAPGRAGPPLASAAGGERMAAIFAGVAALILFGAGLANVDLWAPDEPRYAAIAEELRSGRHGAGGLALLHLGDAPYSQKPPLYFWLAAAFGAASGRVDALAARLPSALAGVACVFGTLWIARRLRWPIGTALLAAALLATSFRFAFTARRAQLDVLLCAFELLAVAVFVALETRRSDETEAGAEAGAAPRFAPAAIALLHAALGAAALVKGPVAWLPLAVFAVFLAWEGRPGAFRALVPAWSWLLSIGPLLIWIASATALAPEGFARDAVGTNVFARFFAGSSHARPFYYYAYQLPLDFLPWSLLFPLAATGLVRSLRARPAQPGWSERTTARLLASWILVPLAFFSVSAGKRGLYLLPIFPALALACALAWTRAAAAGDGSPGAAPRAARGARIRFGVVAAVALLELAGFLLVFPHLDPEKSPRPIAEAIAARSGAGEAVALFGLRPLEGAIPYYGARPVRGIGSEAEALQFFEAGGNLILLRARDFDRLRDSLVLEAAQRFRSGRRELVLARRAAPDPTSAP